MSYVRKRATSLTKPATTNRLSLGNGQNTTKKKLTRPAWDSTQQDLNQLRLSIDELERRRQSHQSKNLDQVRFERQKQEAIKNNKKKNDTESKSDAKAQLALLKEILFDETQLRNLILKSDTTLKTVQGIFQNDDETDSCDMSLMSLNSNGKAQKKQSKINLTLAPNSGHVEPNLPQPATNHRQKTSVTLANTKNVNNMSQLTDKESDIQTDQNLMMKTQKTNANDKNVELLNDLDKYRELLELKRKLYEQKQTSSSTSVRRGVDALGDMEEYLNGLESQLRLKIETAKTATKDEQVHGGIKPQQKQQQSQETQNQRSTTSLLGNLNDDLKQALDELSSQLVDYETKTGRQNGTSSNRFASTLVLPSSSSSFSSGSMTLSLIHMVSRLLDYLKDTTLDLNNEKLKQEELSKQLSIHRRLIDGLTNEVLCVKDQNEKIVGDYINQQAKLEAELDQIKIILRSSDYMSQHSVKSNVNDSNKQLTLLNTQIYTSSRPASSQQTNGGSQQQQQQQQIEAPRPTSSMSAINFNDLMSNTKNGDRFNERLNAMLQADTNLSFGHSGFGKLPSKSMSLEQFNASKPASSFQSDAQSQQQTGSCELLVPTNDYSSCSNKQLANSLNNIIANNKQKLINDFKEQIEDLGMKNALAQQKLKQLQSEHHSTTTTRSNETDSGKPKRASSHSNHHHHHHHNHHHGSSNNQRERKTDSMDKLRQEQELLKEQIELINRQREAAKIELEVLNNSGIAGLNAFNSKLKSLNIGATNLLAENERSTLTPCLSPIQPETNHTQSNDLKSQMNFMQQNTASLAQHFDMTPPKNARH